PAPQRVRRGPTSRHRTHCYAFATPSYLAPRLVEAGFTHLNLANNHANDFGPAAREQTQQTLAGLGLRYYGPLGAISIDTLRQGDSITVVGLVGFTTYPFAYDLLDLERSAVVVDSVKHLVDVLVVTFHGGSEGAAAVRTGSGPEFLAGEPRGNLRLWARRIIDAGADLVVGHGPHVLRGIEFYGGKPIFYSLGNFATYRGFNLAGPLGVTAVLQIEIGGDGSFHSGRLVPLIQRPRTGPAPDPRRSAIRLLRRVTRLDFGPGGALINPDGTIRPPAPIK
ncbi:MAG: CapA family protein, partial [Gemmatimonadales bacterium]